MKCEKCGLEAQEHDYLCRLHRKKANIKDRFETAKEISHVVLAAGFGIFLLVGVLYVIIFDIVEKTNDPNIPESALDKVCVHIYGDDHVFLEYDYKTDSIVCATKIINEVSE